jgi:uncharacterized protein
MMAKKLMRSWKMPEIRYDVIELKASVSPEGWIRDKPVVTRAGIFQYKNTSGKVIREYRPETEVFKDDSLNTLAGIPVTDGHRGIITRNNTSGIIGTVLSPGTKNDEDVIAEVIIHDVEKLGKKRELSMGYTCDVDATPGEWNGERYDAIQKNIKYNHLAVVTKGRAGNAKLRLDHDDAASFPFDQENDMDPKLVTIRLDSIDYQASPEVNNAFIKVQADLVTATKRFDSLEAERDSLKAKLADAEKLIKATKDGARSEVKARLDLEKIATDNKVKFDENDEDQALKVKVLTKLRPELKLDGKSEEYINSAFDLALAYADDKTRKVGNQIKKFDASGDDANNKSGGSAAEAREQMLRRIRGEKVDDKAA